MDWIIGLLLLTVGVIIGFFVAKHLASTSSEQNNQELETTIKQVLAQQASQHIHESRSVLDNIEQQCADLREQLHNYEHLLQEQATDDKQQLAFFGDQASAYLRNKQPKKKEQSNKTDYQPLDYSAESSGLFDGTKNQQSEANESR